MTRPSASALRGELARRTSARVPLALLLAAVTIPRAVALHAAPVTAAVEAGWRAERAGRPELKGPTTGIRRLSPRISILADDGAGSLEGSLSGRFESAQLPGTERFGPLARTAHSARLRAGLAWPDGTALQVSGEHRHSRDRLDPDAPVNTTAGVATTWSAGGDLRSAHAEAGLRMRGWARDRIEEPGGGTAYLWNAAVLPWRGRAAALLLDWRERRFVAGSEPVVWTRAALLGLERVPSPAVRLGVGAGEVSDGSRRRPGAAAVVDVGEPSGRRGLLRAHAEFQARFPALGSMELSHRVGDGWLIARAESAMEYAGSPGLDRVLVRRLGIAVQETLGRATVLAVEASDARSRPVMLDHAWMRTGRATVSLARRVRPWLQAAMAGSFLREWEAAPEAAPPTRRLRFDTSLAVIL